MIGLDIQVRRCWRCMVESGGGEEGVERDLRQGEQAEAFVIINASGNRGFLKST